MAAPIGDPPNLDDAIRAYRDGKSVSECATLCGIGHETFRQRLIARGIPLRGRTGAGLARRIATPDRLADDFLSGESVKALSVRHGIDRNAVYRMLRDLGIDGRDRSTAMALRWQRATTDQREALLAAAHDATRGRTMTREHRVKIAEARRGQPFSDQETALAAMLGALGYDVELGVPCGPYNLDLVVSGTVAVEVFGGNWHETGRHRARFPERSRHVLDAGYSLAIVWAHDPRYSVSVACAQHLGTLVEITRGHPSIRRQHWVIRGDGHFLTVREDDGDEVPFVRSSGSGDG